MADHQQRSSSSNSRSSGTTGTSSSNISVVQSLRVPRRPGADDEAESRLAKRQRMEPLDPFPQRLIKILPKTKVLNRDDEYENYYMKTKNFDKGDAYSCVGLGESGRFSGFMITRVRDKLANVQVSFKEPNLEYFRLYRELLIMGRILPPHAHIVQLKDVLVSRKRIFIVTTKCDWADLNTYFWGATNTTAHRIFKQLCEVVQFMHRHGVVNNNLNPKSILFSEEEYFREIKVINFSRACYNPRMVFEIHKDFNPDDWIEPDEMFYMSNMSNPKSDILMLGRILLAMFTGFWDSNVSKLRTWKFDKEAHDLLKMLAPLPLAPQPGIEMTIDDILQHPWMANGPNKL